MSQLSGARLSGDQFAKNLFFCPIFWGQKLKLKTQNKSCFTLGENLQRISRPKVQCDSRFVNLSHESPPSQWPDQFKGERKGHKSAKIILLSTQTRVSREIVGVFSFKEKIQIILKEKIQIRSIDLFIRAVINMIHCRHFLISPFVAGLSHK